MRLAQGRAVTGTGETLETFRSDGRGGGVTMHCRGAGVGTRFIFASSKLCLRQLKDTHRDTYKGTHRNRQTDTHTQTQRQTHTRHRHTYRHTHEHMHGHTSRDTHSDTGTHKHTRFSF